jgi:glutathione synthase/RimK-type ligase-like ATP-grasp enzyme
VVARTEQELLTALRLAGAAELTMVVQPLLGAGSTVEDVRVYCVDGSPVGALRRTPAEGSVVANVAAGGTGEVVAIPPDLCRRAAAVAAHLDSPWLAVDFLGENGTYHLSEIEIDAYIAPAVSRLPGMEEVLSRRFRAYRDRFDTWLATRDSRPNRG